MGKGRAWRILRSRFLPLCSQICVHVRNSFALASRVPLEGWEQHWLICAPVSWVSWLSVCPAAISGVFVRNTTRLARAYHAQTGGPSKFHFLLSTQGALICVCATDCKGGAVCGGSHRSCERLCPIVGLLHRTGSSRVRMTSYTEVGGHSDLGFRFADNTSRKCAHFDWIPRVRCWR